MSFYPSRNRNLGVRRVCPVEFRPSCWAASLLTFQPQALADLQSPSFPVGGSWAGVWDLLPGPAPEVSGAGVLASTIADGSGTWRQSLLCPSWLTKKLCRGQTGSSPRCLPANVPLLPRALKNTLSGSDLAGEMGVSPRRPAWRGLHESASFSFLLFSTVLQLYSLS